MIPSWERLGDVSRGGTRGCWPQPRPTSCRLRICDAAYPTTTVWSNTTSAQRGFAHLVLHLLPRGPWRVTCPLPVRVLLSPSRVAARRGALHARAQWSVRVTGNWRVVFRFQDNEAAQTSAGDRDRPPLGLRAWNLVPPAERQGRCVREYGAGAGGHRLGHGRALDAHAGELRPSPSAPRPDRCRAARALPYGRLSSARPCKHQPVTQRRSSTTCAIQWHPVRALWVPAHGHLTARRTPMATHRSFVKCANL